MLFLKPLFHFLKVIFIIHFALFFKVINLTRKNLMDFLTEFTNEKHNAGFSYIEFLKHYVAKERSIYTSMNHLKPSGSVYVGKIEKLFINQIYF